MSFREKILRIYSTKTVFRLRRKIAENKAEIPACFNGLLTKITEQTQASGLGKISGVNAIAWHDAAHSGRLRGNRCSRHLHSVALIKKVSCLTASVLICFSFSACGEDTGDEELDRLIANLSTSYLEEVMPSVSSEEAGTVQGETSTEPIAAAEGNETFFDNENAGEQQELLSKTGTIIDVTETTFTLSLADGTEHMFQFGDGFKIYGAEAILDKATVTVTYTMDGEKLTAISAVQIDMAEQTTPS